MQQKKRQSKAEEAPQQQEPQPKPVEYLWIEVDSTGRTTFKSIAPNRDVKQQVEHVEALVTRLTQAMERVRNRLGPVLRRGQEPVVYQQASGLIGNSPVAKNMEAIACRLGAVLATLVDVEDKLEL